MSLPYNQVRGNTLVTSTLEGGQEKSVIIEFDKGGKIDSITYEGEKLDYRSEKFVQLLDNDKNVQSGFHHYNVEKGLINHDVVKFDDLEPIFFVSANVEKIGRVGIQMVLRFQQHIQKALLTKLQVHIQNQ